MNGSQCRPGTAARDGRQIALGGERRLLLVLQRQPQTEAPVTADLHSIGVIARIVDVTPVELPEASGVLRVLVKGSIRARIDALHEADALRADLTVLAETDTTEQPEVEALRTPLLARFEQHTHATRSWPPQEPGPSG